ncbi:MAG: HAD family phosphatase [Acidobacteriaceae bacterium]|nr:HAD family phosphatase [Acidobacteriaceae bacterium]
MIHALLVDLDGTLARTTEANWLSYGAALREVGVEITREHFLDSVQGRNWREFLPELLRAANNTAEPAAVAQRKVELYRETLAEVPINLPLVKLLEDAHERFHLKTALVTSASKANVLELLRVQNLHRLFDVIVTGDDVAEHKPSPACYRLAAQQLGVQPDQCLVYEDAEVGVAAAEAFGALVIRIIF